MTDFNCCIACVMNFIVYDRAYSLYPEATFEACVSLTTGQGYSTANDATIIKYKGRGWDIVSDVFYPAFFFSPCCRLVQDQHTWVINLSTEGIVMPKPVLLCHGTLLLTSWDLDKGITHPHIMFSNLSEEKKMSSSVASNSYIIKLVRQRFNSSRQSSVLSPHYYQHTETSDLARNTLA